ncbi:hypothetical protein [Leuconostoc mesenteroides]|uniref:hypothetical protein n=1 Tax=Leuconostoc mesenteroides TaxID=1245 RepID=UPI001CBC5740|nr:hypothetical protein [Leuconostoc mesenteroides]
MKILFFNVSAVEKNIIDEWADTQLISVKTLPVSIDYDNIDLTRNFDAVIFIQENLFKLMKSYMLDWQRMV